MLNTHNDYFNFYLTMSDGCNLDCDYCYEGQKDNRSASLQTIEKAIEYIYNYYKPPNIICLWGGEPFLNIEGMKKAIEMIPETTQIAISTNGLILDDDLLNIISSRNNITLQLSIDGNFAAMKHRTKEHNGFKKIIHNAKTYAKRTDSFRVHYVVTRNNINCLYESVLFLAAQRFNESYIIGTTLDFNQGWSIQDSFLYETQLMMIRDYILQSSFVNISSTSWLMEVGKQKYLQPAIGTEKGDYSPFTKDIVVDTDGKMYSCTSVRYYSGIKENYFIGTIFDKKKNVGSNQKIEQQCLLCVSGESYICEPDIMAGFSEVEGIKKSHCEMQKTAYDVRQTFRQ